MVLAARRETRMAGEYKRFIDLEKIIFGMYVVY